MKRRFNVVFISTLLLTVLCFAASAILVLGSGDEMSDAQRSLVTNLDRISNLGAVAIFALLSRLTLPKDRNDD